MDNLQQNIGKAEQPSAANTVQTKGGPLFQAGQLVALRANPEVIFPIMMVIPGGGECRYQVFQNNTIATYYESQLQTTANDTGLLPKILIAELQARITAMQLQSPSTANLLSFHSGRIQFVPYQYRPVLKLIRSDQPRLLIADEVGVGKTIESGLIIKELRARMDISSILIVCPRPLVAEKKWFVEMKRFDETFTHLNGPLLNHCLQETFLEGEWPSQYARSILPFSLFDEQRLNGPHGLLKLTPPPKFDLVIVDEAHHLRNTNTAIYRGVQSLCENAEAVIFLTATPIQLGSRDLYVLLNMLRPDIVIDENSYQQMAEPNPHINSAVQHCRAAISGWQHEVKSCLNQATRTDWGQVFLQNSPVVQKIFTQLDKTTIADLERVALIRAIEDLYTFSNLINRTRRRDIGDFTTRLPKTVEVQLTQEQSELHSRLLNLVATILARRHGQTNIKFMMTTICRQAASCLYGLAPLLQDILNRHLDLLKLEIMEASNRDDDPDVSFVEEARVEITSIIEQANRLNPYDPKLNAFIQVISEKGIMANNKVLVFSTFRHTLRYLVEHMQATGLRHGMIHGDVCDEDRATLRRRFALPKEDAEAIDVLFSSEVGCEGLDFQFCDFLVNYDLPWNPMRIEQRIGRIDRYGQKSPTVAIVNLITAGTVDADIYNRCLMRIGVFQNAIGGNEEILGEIAEKLTAIAENFRLTPEQRKIQLRQIEDNQIRRMQEEQRLESQQAELQGLSIAKQAWIEEINDAKNAWLSPGAIQRCVSVYLAERLSPAAEHISGNTEVKNLRLSLDARTALLQDFQGLSHSDSWRKWLLDTAPNLAITFDQQAAREHTPATYLGPTHPLVEKAARFLQEKKAAYASIVVTSSDIPEGKYCFALYRWNMLGVKPDDALVAVALDLVVENNLLTLLQNAQDIDNASQPPCITDFNNLDARHHAKWLEARSRHVEENRLLVEHKRQSLKTSHAGRCQILNNRIVQATDDRIRTMKTRERDRANADYDRRQIELDRQSTSGDIQATPILFGEIHINNSGNL